MTPLNHHLLIVLHPSNPSRTMPAVTAAPTFHKTALVSLIGTYLTKPDSLQAARMLKEAAADGALLPAEADVFNLLVHVVNNLVESGDVEQAKVDLRMCQTRIVDALAALETLPSGDACMGDDAESALRDFSGNSAKPMTPEQREWCVRQVTDSSYAEYSSALTREAAEALPSHELARAVIYCWRDLARDKSGY